MFEMQGGIVSQNAIFGETSPCFFNSNTPSGIITPLRGNKGKKRAYLLGNLIFLDI